jgi:hypothetical protein
MSSCQRLEGLYKDLRPCVSKLEFGIGFLSGSFAENCFSSQVYFSVIGCVFNPFIMSILVLSFFLNRPLLPCGLEGFLLVNLLDNW